MENKFNRALLLDEVLDVYESSQVVDDFDLGSFCVKVLEYRAAESSTSARAVLINGIDGNSLLLNVTETATAMEA